MFTEEAEYSLINKEKHGANYKNTIGWISFSVSWNILNSVVFATLFPNVLKEIDSNYESTFSTINTITTLASSLMLPLIGCLVDFYSSVKQTMIYTEFIGIFITLCFISFLYIPESAKVISAEGIYLFSFFFYRIAIMANNAMLGSFDSKRRVILSLYSNFIGFGSALFSLILCRIIDVYYTIKPIYYIIAFSVFSFFPFLLTFFSIKDPVKSSAVNIYFLDAIKFAYLRIYDTFLLLQMPEYSSVANFLISYFFFSTAGTVYTIFLTTIFLSLFDISLSQSLDLNLYFLASMEVGVIFGIAWSHFSFTSSLTDFLTLLIQIILFTISLILSFIFAIFKWPFGLNLGVALFVGFLYGWNASYSRGYMSKITPNEKKAELFGFYSTFTYLGIACVSGIEWILSLNSISIDYLFLCMTIFTLPSYYFLYRSTNTTRNNGVSLK